jgi:hypothetical protein
MTSVCSSILVNSSSLVTSNYWSSNLHVVLHQSAMGTYCSCGYPCPFFPGMETCTCTRNPLVGNCPPSWIPANRHLFAISRRCRL